MQYATKIWPNQLRVKLYTGGPTIDNTFHGITNAVQELQAKNVYYNSITRVDIQQIVKRWLKLAVFMQNL